MLSFCSPRSPVICQVIIFLYLFYFTLFFIYASLLYHTHTLSLSFSLSPLFLCNCLSLPLSNYDYKSALVNLISFLRLFLLLSLSPLSFFSFYLTLTLILLLGFFVLAIYFSFQRCANIGISGFILRKHSREVLAHVVSVTTLAASCHKLPSFTTLQTSYNETYIFKPAKQRERFYTIYAKPH